MNILFIEDDKELLSSGVAQLEVKGYRVYPAFDIAESRAIMRQPDLQMDLVITDHHLPDGMGIQFLLELLEDYPTCKCAVVSGCLTPADIGELEKHNIPYYHKPLLYSHVVDDLRRNFSLKATEHVEPDPEPEPQPDSESKGWKDKFRGLWPEA